MVLPSRPYEGAYAALFREASRYRRRSAWPWRNSSGQCFSYLRFICCEYLLFYRRARITSTNPHRSQHGGVISVVAAARNPNLLAGVVNLDGAVPITASGRDGYRDLFARINREGFQPVVAQFIRQVFFLPFEHGAISEEIVTEMISHPEGLASALLK